MAITVIEAKESTLMFRGLSDEDVKDDDETTPEIGGGFDDKKPKTGTGEEDVLPEEDLGDLEDDKNGEDDLEDDGTPDM